MPVEQFKYLLIEYKIISNNVKVYQEPVQRTKKIPHCAVKFEAGEENRIVYERISLIQHFKCKFFNHFWATYIMILTCTEIHLCVQW